MTVHMTLRLAWHNDGWNGRICENPANNTYCVGCASYPGELIREQRDLDWEKKHAGEKFSDLEKPAPCMYSGSAFSEEGCEVLADPPEFFNDDTEIKRWRIPPATACTWPYEAMYNMEGVKKGNGYDYDKRLEHAENYFKGFEGGKSLVFYYANYSNPLSDNENRRYLLVGVARLKEIAPTIFYENCSERTLERYKGFVWQRGVTSHYPEQGIRLPYHRYLNKPDVLQQFAAYPENANLCKYATKVVSDDEALGLLEQMLESARIVRDDVQDDSENWDQRINWLEALIGELWKSRGAYPGMPAVLEQLGVGEAISGFRSMVEQGKESEAYREVADFLAGKTEYIAGFYPHKEELEEIRRNVLLREDEHVSLLLNVMSRISVTKSQLEAILSDDRIEVGITSSISQLEANPYLFAEQYSGTDPADAIRWSMVDRGMLPSPELSAEPLFKRNSKERLRALILETLRGNPQQTFLPASLVVDQVNRRVKAQPEWKQNLITEKYLAVDKAFYDSAIYQRREGGADYLYDLKTWEEERLVEQVLSRMLTAPDLDLPRPVGKDFWHKVLFHESSSLAKNAREEYEEAITEQGRACQKSINKRFVAMTGGAGTGKSTVIKALIKGVYKVHGDGASIAVIAPTGKATDRIRRLLDEDDLDTVAASTIHSILARYGWLNPNMTFRQSGGKRLGDYGVIIIDESSMIDLSLMAALFRAVDWSAVSRLILVGDAAQLPPIGVGKLYADIIAHLRDDYPDNFVVLDANLRQLENCVSGKGGGILSLADLFINRAVRCEDESEEHAQAREDMISKLHEGGVIDDDLDVVYWADPEVLQRTLIARITQALTTEGNREQSDSQKWGKALQGNINCFQILSPVRGELYGAESINQSVQAFKSQHWIKRGKVDGITLFDKVIQIANRPQSRALKGYDFDRREEREDIEIFNGEIGSAVPVGNEWKKIKWDGFQVKRFAVKFSGKESLAVKYFGRAMDKPEANLELAYAISVHKAQGSEFDHVYFVLPELGKTARYMELVYTALTRAAKKCTVFIEKDVSTIVNAMRPEQSSLSVINSSLFRFQPVKEHLINRSDWYEAGKVHQALTGDMVRSKSEVIIANILHDRGVNFWYERPLKAPDGSLYLPDFTLQVGGELYFWEHLGMLSRPEYKAHWEEKARWYETHFPGKLVTTEEGRNLSAEAQVMIGRLMGEG